MMLIPLLLLQVATFQSYVDEARVKLGLKQPLIVETYTKEIDLGEGPVMAWVPHQTPNRIRVWNTTLAKASRDAQKVIAYHETCHHYLMKMELDARGDEFRADLVHELQRFCTIRTLGRDLNNILRKLGNGTYGNRLSTVTWWRRHRQCR